MDNSNKENKINTLSNNTKLELEIPNSIEKRDIEVAPPYYAAFLNKCCSNIDFDAIDFPITTPDIQKTFNLLINKNNSSSDESLTKLTSEQNDDNKDNEKVTQVNDILSDISIDDDDYNITTNNLLDDVLSDKSNDSDDSDNSNDSDNNVDPDMKSYKKCENFFNIIRANNSIMVLGVYFENVYRISNINIYSDCNDRDAHRVKFKYFNTLYTTIQINNKYLSSTYNIVRDIVFMLKGHWRSASLV
jgi:hypothetical protein